MIGPFHLPLTYDRDREPIPVSISFDERRGVKVQHGGKSYDASFDLEKPLRQIIAEYDPHCAPMSPWSLRNEILLLHEDLFENRPPREQIQQKLTEIGEGFWAHKHIEAIGR